MSETIERYIETIRDLEKHSKKVRTKDIASKMDIKEPSVTEMLHKLKKRGLVKYEPYKGANLTQQGREIAKELMKKHATFADFLKMLGVEEDVAEEDACRIEHIVSTKTVKRLRKFLRFVEESPEDPKWLKHYLYFVKTGKHSKCERRDG